MIDRPFTAKLELTRGCNLSCDFCPVDHYKEQGKYKFLNVVTATLFAQQLHELHPTCRVELAMRGEPTMNPDCVAIVAAIRKHAPTVQISMFTNGVRFLKAKAMPGKLFDAGVNILNIDCYEDRYVRFQKLFKDLKCAEVKDFRDFSAYRRYPKGWELRVANLVPDLPTGLVKVRQVHNYGGNVNPEYYTTDKELPLAKRCARPFREVVVDWKGGFMLCCQDWSTDHKVLGNIRHSSLSELWYGKAHASILSKLHGKKRHLLSPCDKCDYFGGYRVGLLKDPSS